MVTPILKNRPAQEAASNALKQAGIHDLMARLLASRGVTDATQIDPAWRNMIPPNMLTQAREAAILLADAIARRDRMLIIADYDCDGATACAVGLRALRSMGAVVDFLVPNRFETGYGLSPAVVKLAEQHPSGKPDLLITVDNGIASIDGVEAAHMAGMKVLVTDHHLPGDELPDALAIVNPNQPGCEFPSKNLAGVGVIFYLMLALRAELRQRGVYEANAGPRLNELADLVALGTVADVVSLDANNRLIVTQGLERMRKGQMQAGLRALFQVAGRDPRQASAFDLGFALGPRINAAGRLADMALGIRCLITDDEDEAANLARELEDMNQDRRSIEQSMREEALRAAELAEPDTSATVCVFHPEWHQGIVGLVASRLKEKYWRPTLAFAQGDEGEIKGSGRSIPDVHLRDALDLVSKRYPGLILKFGGHAMAAGLTIEEDNYDVFVQAFEEAVQELTGRYQFDPIIETDGSLEPEHINITVAGLLQKQVWGAGFPAPVFRDNFFVRQQRLLKNKHLKLSLERNGEYFDAIWFNRDTLLPENIEAAYRLDQNEWNGNVSVQFIIEYAQGQD
ncbi:single-stranded-DNA-specific exonuclease RecJ [Alcaligenes faecalis]|uniref:single-stranded-DNA-specific exonuclease RecJ n=1 Tax=Alcaligenes faecalis TaxID=511 RepID=UPI0005A9F4E8|nr:single-stranded-DNA-specific exonuclease RecJ [Alcaligenes faecalis]ATH99378.1 single-stranded-DNA-specific exonuclease RecJ [Alcaligenes faecalis]AYZ92165.1 single-stranded-DNA-specific exonuclease RecJ [Alcaligenes faecalis]MCX5592892.1 single-stranded-DNA-specific exonuclease RecJ [Alcaligenes faecalis]QQC32033.1 single-stranded-DNA-specific exonuclease RecJ [Alcaligenes faecalis]CAJ0902231.1 Single-stranded-DNA-specific exonuclease RecJ [Alcaligenes faecalis subsp. faecalis]